MRFRISILMLTMNALIGLPIMATGQQPVAKSAEPNIPASVAQGIFAPEQDQGVWALAVATPADAKILAWSRYLGADLAAVDAPLRSQLKLNDGEAFVVTAVKPDGAGAEGGLVLYDVVVGLNDEPKPEATYPFHVWRRGDRQALTLKLKPDRQGWIGVNLNEIDTAMRAQLSLPVGRGLLVQDVADNSPAKQAGLQQFDVIDGWIDGTPSGTVEEFSKIIQKSDGKALGVQILRHGKSLTINLTPQKRPVETATADATGGANLLWLRAINANLPARRQALTLGEFVTHNQMALPQWRGAMTAAVNDRQAKLSAVEQQLDQLLKEVQAARQAIEEIRKLEERTKEKK